MNTKFDVNDLKQGDVFSEESHYRFQQRSIKGFEFTHVASGQTITLDEKYVTDLLTPADQFTQEMEVGKEDKYWTEKQIAEAIKKRELPADTKVRVGDVRVPGIRTIWANIYSSKVFTVFFYKQDKELSSKALTEAREKQIAEAMSKLGARVVASKIRKVVEEIVNNPVLPSAPGELRKLRGYKTQFSSINGNYGVIDLDITSGSAERQVNVNQIQELIYDGVRYIVK